jgi:hypothetical protein
VKRSRRILTFDTTAHSIALSRVVRELYHITCIPNFCIPMIVNSAQDQIKNDPARA